MFYNNRQLIWCKFEENITIKNTCIWKLLFFLCILQGHSNFIYCILPEFPPFIEYTNHMIYVSHDNECTHKNNVNKCLVHIFKVRFKNQYSLNQRYMVS